MDALNLAEINKLRRPGFLAVWQDYRSDIYEDIYGQVTSPNGSGTGGNFPICGDGANQYAPDVASDGSTKYLVVWHDFRHNQPDFHGRLIVAPTAIPQMYELLLE